MSIGGGLSELLSGQLTKYIMFQFDSLPSNEQEYSLEQSKFLSDVEEFFTFVEPSRGEVGEVLAIDGSSRSFLSSRGLVSVSSVALTSNLRGIVGLFPSFDASKTLDLRDPFIAVVGGFKTGFRIEDFLGLPFVANLSAENSSLSPETMKVLESELRFGLETSLLSKVKGDDLLLVDGPLFPTLIFLPKRYREKLLEIRKEAIKKNFVGIVKRVNTSRTLISAFADRDLNRQFQSKFGVNPLVFSSDEGLLTYLTTKLLKPPFPTTKIGPIEKVVYGVRVYSEYLVIPIHPYVRKFSILRVESLSNRQVGNLVASMPMTGDGIPKVLAMSDKVAKEMSNAVYSLLVNSLIMNGLQESFYSRLEGVNS